MDAIVDAVIVGAGVSGLATAESLVEKGLKVVVLEARSRTGGRLLTLDGADLGATWFWDGEDRVLELLNRLKVDKFEQFLAGSALCEGHRGEIRKYAGNPIDSPAWRYIGGAARITDALAARLPPDTIRLDHAVESVTVEEGSATLNVQAKGSVWRAKHVVLALPPALAVESIQLPSAISSKLRHAASLTPVWMGQIAKVVAVFDEPFWRKQGLAGAASSVVGPMGELHDMSGPNGTPAAIFGFADASSIGPNAEERSREQFLRLFGSNPRKVYVQNWNLEQYTTPASQVTTDGRGSAPSKSQYAHYGSPVYQSAELDGRLHWVSTETATESPGHIEGALQAAERAVSAITAHLGL